jgi:large subunit ribosomal protein L13
MSTYVPRKDEVRNDWYVLDAENQVLGRVAARAAVLLMGKHKPDYTPFLKTGDHVVIVNAAKLRLTGRKEEGKIYRTHSGYPGGLKEMSAGKMHAKYPERMLEIAIKGMLPKNKIGKQLGTRLKVYAGAKHGHEAQQPKPLSL